MKTLLIIFLFAGDLAFGMTGDELLKKMDKVRSYKTAHLEAQMTIVNSSGDKTVMGVESWEKVEGDKSLMRFKSPARLKGTAILTVGDSIWYYNRRTNRARLLSKSAKKGSVAGSSFSYEDMSADYAKDFRAEITKEDSEFYEVKLTPKDLEKKFSYLMAKVSKYHFVATKVQYFNDKGIKYKELTAGDIKRVNGNWVALKVSMTEVMTQKITHFTISEEAIKYDLELKDSLFSERNLKR
jgi:hypothetical protein